MIGGAYALSLALLAAQGTEADYERAAGVGDLLRGKLVRVEVDAQWSEDGDAFTYRRSLPESIEYVRVDAVAGTRGPAFDHARLATALKAATDGEQDPRKLDLRRLSFTEDGGFEFTLDERRWRASPDLDQLEDLGKDERSDERRVRTGQGSRRSRG